MKSIERERLIDEYRESLRLVRRAHQRAKQRRDEDQDEQAALDCQQLSSMERDLQWVIDYLEKGCMPEYHRGAYKWTVPVDPSHLKRMVKAKPKDGGQSRWSTPNVDLRNLLSVLSPREREAFIMVRGRGISYRQAAEYLGVSPGTVSAMVRRAERKVRRTAYLLASNEVCRAPHTIRVKG